MSYSLVLLNGSSPGATLRLDPDVGAVTIGRHGTRELALDDDRAKLRKKYWKRFKKALPATLAARFLQLEHQIELLVDLQIASEVPLIE